MSQPPADGVVRSAGAASSALERAAADPNNVLTIIGTITSQAALITALFYYFGWARTYSLFNYFGVDSNLVGYSTEDYVLRSIDVAFPWFIYAPLVAIFLFGVHRVVLIPALIGSSDGLSPPLNAAARSLSGPICPCDSLSDPSQAMGSISYRKKVLRRWRPGVSCVRRFIRHLELIAIVLAGTVPIEILFRERVALSDLLPPLSLIVSVILLGYVAHVRWKYPDVLVATTILRRANQPPRAYALTLLALGLVAAIWAISVYGDRLGTKYAAEIAADVAARSEIVVYSTDLIALYGPGVSVVEIAQPGNKYHYKYTGLRLLAHPPDKFLLLPLGWQKGRDRVFLLRDDDSMRIDITAH